MRLQLYNKENILEELIKLQIPNDILSSLVAPLQHSNRIAVVKIESEGGGYLKLINKNGEILYRTISGRYFAVFSELLPDTPLSDLESYYVKYEKEFGEKMGTLKRISDFNILQNMPDISLSDQILLTEFAIFMQLNPSSRFVFEAKFNDFHSQLVYSGKSVKIPPFLECNVLPDGDIESRLRIIPGFQKLISDMIIDFREILICL